MRNIFLIVFCLLSTSVFAQLDSLSTDVESSNVFVDSSGVEWTDVTFEAMIKEDQAILRKDEVKEGRKLKRAKLIDSATTRVYPVFAMLLRHAFY